MGPVHDSGRGGGSRAVSGVADRGVGRLAGDDQVKRLVVEAALVAELGVCDEVSETGTIGRPGVGAEKYREPTVPDAERNVGLLRRVDGAELESGVGDSGRYSPRYSPSAFRLKLACSGALFAPVFPEAKTRMKPPASMLVAGNAHLAGTAGSSVSVHPSRLTTAFPVFRSSISPTTPHPRP